MIPNKNKQHKREALFVCVKVICVYFYHRGGTANDGLMTSARERYNNH